MSVADSALNRQTPMDAGCVQSNDGGEGRRQDDFRSMNNGLRREISGGASSVSDDHPIWETARPSQAYGDEPCATVSEVTLRFSPQSTLTAGHLTGEEHKHDTDGAVATKSGEPVAITAAELGDEKQERRATFASVTTAATMRRSSMADDANNVDANEDYAEEGHALPREEQALNALVHEFREAAGYDAAYEEKETRLTYETVLRPDGSSQQVLVGATFDPGPLRVTVCQVIKVTTRKLLRGMALAGIFILYVIAMGFACDSTVVGLTFDIVSRAVMVLTVYLFLLHLTDGCNLPKIISRLKTSWWLVVTPLTLSIMVSVAYHAHWDRRSLRCVFWLFLVCSLIWPYAHFYTAAKSLGVRNKWGYAVKAGTACAAGIVALGVLGHFVRSTVKATTTDADKTRRALIFVLAMLPIISLISKLARSMKEGPPTLNGYLAILIKMVLVIYPRLLQAEMVRLSAKIFYSVLISLLDLLSDIFLPYWILLFIAARRFLRDRRRKATRPSSNDSKTIAAVEKMRKITSLSSRKDHDTARHENASMTSSRILRAGLSYIAEEPIVSHPPTNLQSALASLDVSPRYLRALSEQIRVWAFLEVTVLLFSNLVVLISNQIWGSDSSHVSFLQGTQGPESVYLTLRPICCSSLHVLFVVLIRWNNLPMVRAEYESSVVWCRCLMCLWTGLCCISTWYMLFAIYTMRAMGEEKWGDAGPAELCPGFSFVIETWQENR
ncbi:unnamed protein product [Vitrella brassicaformis CCMP3155]|uniref:Uncharacterized protein n=1 Tax=Vitrella brassicaformis (strain CCMP3155) TaxID=1169540 RepID=A0A0G4EW36_VITBC|nr:unnamed protein product [Vitrella brassicaformis CCMP3155]|eukprot:CEM02662.1 unnamed protein product [Vitrella brassicaformis CCMP3155]